MKLAIDKKGNYQYAKVPGTSYREDGKVKKKGTIYLGRVIDLENHVFYNKERGVFTYDPDTGTFGEADASYQGLLKKDRRRREKLILDFGDTYFLDQLIRQMHYDEVLEKLGYGNPDTLHSMVAYYVLSEQSNMHAHTWYQGNIASVLYPDADLHSPRISDFLDFLGREDVRRKYFNAHIAWVKEQICEDPAIIVDSTGIPNDIRMELTQTNNHNGRIEHEMRMVTAVQRDSGCPLMFRAVAGNIVDVSTLPRTVAILSEYGIQTDFALLDAGYFSEKNADSLCDAGIDFITRLPARNKTLYRTVLDKGLDGLRKPENLVQFQGRYVYIKQVECTIGTKKQKAYAYIGYDVDGSGDTNHKAISSTQKKKKSTEEMHKIFASSGIFVLLSTLPFRAEDVLEVYYIRQAVEQYFDLSKGASRLAPLRVHNEQRVMGHLLLCQIAATINLTVQKKMEQCQENRERLFLSLRNQKCEVFSDKVITYEGQSGATKFYDVFHIKSPIGLVKRKQGWKPMETRSKSSNAAE